ncbi:threonine synthase, partial [candidate division KSB1 bacterium]|nr:threonine synthase [candidate division KSB1 bacterium]
MKFYSTKNRANAVSLRKAVLKGMPADNGLYMPETIPEFEPSFFNRTSASFQEVSFEIARQFVEDDIPGTILSEIISDAINFDAPLIRLSEQVHVLELFHGPTLAFKDFGARFMSRIMSYFVQESDQSLNVLVATSGDTGSAVANGFYGVPGINVIILYPSGKISDIQEKQIATLDKNITALEIDGTFDDCQQLVKSAFLDPDLDREMRLTSANSINIARLLPQSFYYFRAIAQLKNSSKNEIIVSVPSGNFGNLTAGLIAGKMGLPLTKFVAATNTNAVVPEYLESGKFVPRPSLQTISNAMDVGNPSNFARMLDLYDHSVKKMRSDIIGHSYSEESTRQVIKDVKEQFGYTLDPHGAVGFAGLSSALQKNQIGIFL